MKNYKYSPVNKNIKLNIPQYFLEKIHVNDGVSVICSTNKKYNKKNILTNFLSQNYKKKELIIILNYDNPDINCWKNEISSFDNIHIYGMDSKYSLGTCLNYATKQAKYPIIAKFDDDDYYGPEYLSDSIKPFYFTNASVIGKATTYVYFVKEKILALRNINRENRYLHRVEGPTLIFKKDIFKKVKFKNKNLGEDINFCKDCLKNNFKIYSTNKNNFVYIRNNENTHTWQINNEYYLKQCAKICKTDNFKNYI